MYSESSLGWLEFQIHICSSDIRVFSNFFSVLRCRVQENTCIKELLGGPELLAFECSEDATKSPQGALMHVVSMDGGVQLAKSYGNACTQFKFGAAETANERCFLATASRLLLNPIV